MRVILLGVVLAMAAAAPANTFADDKQIAEFIKAKLVQEQQRGNLYGFNVDMRVDRGTVWFKGFVSNRNQELMILRTAQLAGHLGVTQVVDDIEVQQSNSPMAAQPSLATPQPLAPQSQQSVRQRESVMTSTQNPYEMYQRGGMTSGMQAIPAPQRLPQADRNMPMPQQPRANTPAMPRRHGMPMTMPMSRLDDSNEVEIQEAGSPLARELADARVEMESEEATESVDDVDDFKTDSPSFQDALARSEDASIKTVAASASVPAPVSVPTAAPVAGPPLPFARAAASGPVCQGGACAGGCGGACGAGGSVDGFGGGFGGEFAGSFGAGGYDSGSANLPGYAWPSYAAHPNYGAVSYPKQYSPSAWPYIGPFYPYPQVPLGWRRVALEWDDGWWYLDFYDRNSSR